MISKNMQKVTVLKIQQKWIFLMNPYGYSYKFNFDFFIRSLVSLISLPNLIINIGDKFTIFKELDIAYYNKQIIQNKNSFLLRASLYREIKDNNINC